MLHDALVRPTEYVAAPYHMYDRRWVRGLATSSMQAGIIYGTEHRMCNKEERKENVKHGIDAEWKL